MGLFKMKGFQNIPLSRSCWTWGLSRRQTTAQNITIRMYSLAVSRCVCLDSDISLQQYFLSIQGHLEFVRLNLTCVLIHAQFFSHIFLLLSSLGLINQPLNLNQHCQLYGCIWCRSFNYEYLNVAYPRLLMTAYNRQHNGPKNDRQCGWQRCHKGTSCENTDMPWDATLGGHPRLSSEL